jgi:ABC-type bacteriocin/lantibiotic exporter with double-glycine peptidase domain
MNVHEGEFLGITGPSGCGKSTLLRMLANIEVPSSGDILYEETKIYDIDQLHFRSQVGIVLQSSRIIAGTVQRNILCGRNTTQECLLEALRVSKSDEIIANFPMGLQTLLPTGGKVLSTGQQQRLLLARALLSEPKVLILDEATSGIYLETQREIFAFLKEKKITVILVSHDQSILSLADRVIKLS